LRSSMPVMLFCSRERSTGPGEPSSSLSSRMFVKTCCRASLPWVLVIAGMVGLSERLCHVGFLRSVPKYALRKRFCCVLSYSVLPLFYTASAGLNELYATVNLTGYRLVRDDGGEMRGEIGIVVYRLSPGIFRLQKGGPGLY
jgi:hypothetical protein